MRYVDPRSYTQQLENCWLSFSKNFTVPAGQHPLFYEIAFSAYKYHLERTAGVTVEIKNRQIQSLEVVNPAQFTMWVLKWS